MANSFFGETTVEHGGETYTLCCDFNAMAAFEAETGLDALEEFERMEKGEVKFGTLIAIAWSMLVEHHPEIDMKLAGKVISADTEALTRVIEAARPKAEEVGDLGNGETAKDAAEPS